LCHFVLEFPETSFVISFDSLSTLCPFRDVSWPIINYIGLPLGVRDPSHRHVCDDSSPVSFRRTETLVSSAHSQTDRDVSSPCAPFPHVLNERISSSSPSLFLPYAPAYRSFFHRSSAKTARTPARRGDTPHHGAHREVARNPCGFCCRETRRDGFHRGFSPCSDSRDLHGCRRARGRVPGCQAQERRGRPPASVCRQPRARRRRPREVEGQVFPFASRLSRAQAGSTCTARPTSRHFPPRLERFAQRRFLIPREPILCLRPHRSRDLALRFTLGSARGFSLWFSRGSEGCFSSSFDHDQGALASPPSLTGNHF
jgi:hypothetical protein